MADHNKVSRTLAEAREAWGQMVPLRDVGYDLVPLRANRLPFTGWREADYAGTDFVGHLRRGGQVGVRLGAGDLIVDVDPRNGGANSFSLLLYEHGIDLDRDGVPTVRSGGGGRHFYLRKPPDLITRVKLTDRLPGIDFKKSGGFIVAPGALHPSGNRYTWLRPLDDRGVPQAPRALLDLLHQSHIEIAPAGPGTPVLTPDELERLLAVVDATLYGKGRREEWIQLSAACHDAVRGNPEAFEVWAYWCTSDPEFSDLSDDALRATWNSFRVGKGVTFRTLFKAVSDAGRADLVRHLSTRLDFDNYSPEEI